MIRLSALEVAQIMGGQYSGPENLQLDGEFCFDSRMAKSGSIFMALTGAKADGHHFVADAFSRGATLAVVSKPVSGNHILVSDVLAAVAALAKELRSRLKNLRVVAITGSQGKTTTKDMLNSILSSVGECIAPESSYNNEIGVPITILRCTSSTRFCIVEMGARHKGDIEKLTEIAAPDVGIVLKVGTAHIGEFGSRQAIAQTKGELIQGLKSGATAVLGTYDEFTPLMKSRNSISTLTFGEQVGCDIRAADIELHGGFPAFDLVTPEGRERVELQTLGMHQIANALAAAGAAIALGISTMQISAALSTHQSASKWRMELLELGELTLINDSYNANPESMSAALRTLALLAQERGGNAWAFLGKMHELGEESASLHKEIGVLVGELGIDHLVVIGEQDFLIGPISSNTSTHFFSTVQDSFQILQRLEPGDVVLVKASRAEHLETLAEQIVSIWKEEIGELT